MEKAEKKDTKRIVAIVLICIFLAFAIFFIFELNLSNLSIKDNGNLDHNYGKVLSNIDNITVANPYLKDIYMLGSHDSCTCDINSNSKADENAGFGMKMMEVLGKGYFIRYAKTQTVGAYDQLMQGSRYLHIKYSFTDGDWYSTHSITSGKMAGYIVDILKYLSEQTGEIVILNFHPCGFNGYDMAQFHEWLGTITYNEKNIYDYVYYSDTDVFNEGNGKTKISDLRYNDITQTGTKSGLVLIDTRDYKHMTDKEEGSVNAYTYKFFDLDTNARNDWHNRNSNKALIKGIQETAESIKADANAKNMLRINQTQHALGAKGFDDFISSLFGCSLLHLAEKYNVSLIENENLDFWLDTMPIFSVDFVNSNTGSFNERINKIIIDKNKGLIAGMMEP